jgi:hypothetical protein
LFLAGLIQWVLRVQRKLRLNRGAPISVGFANRKHWSNAAWPS